MTNEHDQQHSDIDADVRRLYRDLAVETTPDHLDDAVLQAARAAARPEYARARAWTRPLAWAATIVLTVAVVVEINRVPAPEMTPEREFAPVSRNQAEVSPAAAAEEPAADLAIQPPPGSAVLQKAMPVPDSAGQSTAAPATLEETAPEGRQDTAFEEAATESRREIAVDQESQTGDLLQDSDAIARPQAVTLRSRALSALEDDATCPQSARETPETWLECIGELEAAGLSDSVTEQRRLFQQAFPDFRN